MIAVLTGLIAFLGIASLIKPEPRAARAIPSMTPTFNHGLEANSLPRTSGNTTAGASLSTIDPISRRLAATPHPKGWKLLGQLEGREYLVLMFASPEGARYSVYSLAGDLLMADLAADDVYRAFPTLDLTTLHDLPNEGGTTIMLAEPIE